MRKVFLKAFFLVAAWLCAAPFVSAQISHGGEPLFNHSKAMVSNVVLPTLDNNVYLQQDIDMKKGASPLRVGKMQNTSVSNLSVGTVTKLSDGTRVWRVAVSSPNATFVTIHFDTFDIPEGARLFVYDATGDFVLGSFVRQDTIDGFKFHTQAIPGSLAYVEYIEPASVAGKGRISINRVCHGYKDLFTDVFEDMKGAHGTAEGNCHINVVCPEGDDWRDQIRSVVAIQIVDNEDAYMCSGALVNNTANDGTPYVLSAFHCQDLSNTNLSWTTYFLYETRYCGASAGTAGKSMVGANIMAKYTYNGGSDFLLLKLKKNIPDDYTPYYAGWSRENVAAPTPGVCIHHPGGDYKKLSFPQSIIRGTGTTNRNFYITNWFTGTDNKGVTEHGSSGSPLFDSNKRIIGQLYAGSSSCTVMDGTDLYGRVYSSWTGNNTAESRLSDWLDPLGTGVTTLDGIDYTDIQLGIRDMHTDAKKLSVYPNPSTGMIYINVFELGMANYKVFSLDGRCLREGRTVLTTADQAINLTTLPSGAYKLVLFTSGNTYSQTILIK